MLIALPAWAQEPAPAPDPLAAVHAAAAANAYWPDSLEDGELLVVTLAEPGKRQHCKVLKSTADSLSCKRALGLAPRVYQRAEVGALVSSARHSHTGLWLLGSLGVEGGILYGAVLLNPITTVGAVAVGVAGTMVWFVGAFVIALMDEGNRAEELVYLRPETALTVKLRK